ncbi:putative S-locus glycoprotein domain-containing protein [Tanacetum coccineum]
MVKLDSYGILSIVNSGGTVIWSSKTSASRTNVKSTAQLLDNGNLVIKDEDSVLWQSFDYPGDTFISGMKLGKNFITGRETNLTSWKSVDDPSPGEYTLRFSMVKGKYIQVYISKSSAIETRIGPIDGIEFAGLPNYRRELLQLYISLVVNENEMYYSYTSHSITSSLRSVVTPGGRLEIWQLNMLNQEWKQDLTLPVDYCDNYGICGPYGSCTTATFPNCPCLKGFELKDPQELYPYNWTSGCKRSRALDCGPGEGFIKFPSMKLPDTENAVYDGSMSLQECEVACKNNCSCTAYANPNNTRSGVGCLQWFGDLIDVRIYSLNGQDLYVRLAASELLGDRYALGKKNATVPMEDLDDLPFFSLHEIVKATNHFNVDNKLGEGGFGPVYKVSYWDVSDDMSRIEVAVKRLSETSQQGLDEFKNEVICIAKLQHRNLVKLLGYCVHGNEKILVYEYMANKSLDRLLFDENRSSMLNWPQRFHIINGMARGILYLHQDSRLQIIHRDLKAGNILLDDDMNPKISDFGLARKFVGSDSTAKTKKVVGTHGYISPEYAVHGHYSTKSDVFSFGVMVLEIVSGKKNRGFCHEDHSDNLLGHAWRLYKENRSIELMRPSLHDTASSLKLLYLNQNDISHPFFTGESQSEVVSIAEEYTITQTYAR